MAPKQSASKRPASALKRPASTVKRPAAALKRPAAARRRPAAAVKRPAAALKRPAVAAKRPAAALRRPAAALKRPTSARPAARRSASTSAAARAPAKRAKVKPGPATESLRDLCALCLSLERRPDRWERCRAMLKKEVPWLNVELFPATDGKTDVIPEDEVSKTWNTKRNALYGAYEDVMDRDGKVVHTAAEFADPGVEYDFSSGERGCAHSHYRMWQRAAEGQGPTLILEDDVQLEFERSGGGLMGGEIFTARLHQGMEKAEKRSADVLYLGWAGFRDGNLRHLSLHAGFKSGVIRRAEYVWTTVAYVLWPSGAKKLLEQAKPMNQPVDNFMGWESREGRLNAWVLLDEGDTDDTWSGGIVTQLDFTGDSDIKKSDGGDQGDDPTEYLVKKALTMAQPQEALVDVATAASIEGGEVGPCAGVEEVSAATEALANAPTESPATAASAADAEGGAAGDADMTAGSEVSGDVEMAPAGAEADFARRQGSQGARMTAVTATMWPGLL